MLIARPSYVVDLPVGLFLPGLDLVVNRLGLVELPLSGLLFDLFEARFQPAV